MSFRYTFGTISTVSSWYAYQRSPSQVTVARAVVIPHLSWEKCKRQHVYGEQAPCQAPPFEGWVLLRGMRTLSIRFHRACENASAIAHHFHGHPKVERVLYPGLKCHPGHEVAARQMLNGFGGMVSLLVKGGWDEARTVLTGTKVFICATSLGGVESLIEHRAAVQSAGCVVAQNLVRLSVGIEHKNDLIDDLEQSLSRI